MKDIKEWEKYGNVWERDSRMVGRNGVLAHRPHFQHLLHLGRFRLSGARNKKNTGEDFRISRVLYNIFIFLSFYLPWKLARNVLLLCVGWGDCYEPVKSSWRSPLCRERWNGHRWWIGPARWSECASPGFAPRKSVKINWVILKYENISFLSVAPIYPNFRQISKFCHFLDMVMTVTKWKEYSTSQKKRGYLTDVSPEFRKKIHFLIYRFWIIQASCDLSSQDSGTISIFSLDFLKKKFVSKNECNVWHVSRGHNSNNWRPHENQSDNIEWHGTAFAILAKQFWSAAYIC